MSYTPLNLVYSIEQDLNNKNFHSATLKLAALKGYLQAITDFKVASELSLINDIEQDLSNEALKIDIIELKLKALEMHLQAQAFLKTSLARAEATTRQEAEHVTRF